MFELTIQFNIEKIGKLQRFGPKFELSGTLNFRVQINQTRPVINQIGQGEFHYVH